MLYKIFKKFGLIVLFLSLISSAVMAMPSTVIVIRHAEKPKDKADIHLNAKGYQRAAALPQFFQKFHKTAPLRLVAQGQKRADSSLRPIETLIPTSDKYSIEINKQFVKDESSEMVQHVKTSNVYDKKTVVISWGHDELGNIAQLLGKDYGEWDSAIFDRAWIFYYNASGKLIKFTDTPQNLLPGDSEE